MIGANPTAGRLPTPPREPEVQVEAIAATWCVDGRTVEVGRRYSVLASVAVALEQTGKARRA